MAYLYPFRVARLVGRAVRGGRLSRFNGAGDPFRVNMAAAEGFSIALGMCGNSGQVSIIEQTSYDAFVGAGEAVVEGGDAVSVLMDNCPYPDAVEEILEEAGQAIQDIVEDAMGGSFGEDFDEGEEEW